MKHFAAFLLSASLLLVFSCSNPLFLSSGSEEASGVIDLEDDNGNVRLLIPRYAPWLLFAIEGADETDSSSFSSKSVSSSQSRAYAVADEVMVKVWDTANPPVLLSTETFTPQTSSPEPVEIHLDLIAGNSYSFDVEIYNHDVSETEPVVAGRYENFTVTDGAVNDVSVTCIPVDPVVINLDDPAAVDLSMITTQLDQDGNLAEAGGEVWVSFTAPANGAVILPLSLPAGTMLGVQFYDAQGLPYDGAEPFLVEESSTGTLTDLTPGETYYMGLGLVAETRSEQTLAMEVQSAVTITGTLTLPGYFDPSIVPGMGGILLDSTLTIPVPDLDFDYMGEFPEPNVTASGLEWTYTLFYDGGPYTGYLYGAFINNLGNWPSTGDIFGVYDGNTDTEPDYATGAGIEPVTFAGSMSGIDFELQLLGADPVPAAAFPDATLRAAMEHIIGKQFTGLSGGVTFADLGSLTRIDLADRNEVYGDLTGLELCAGAYELYLRGNDLSGCDLTGGGTTAAALEGMDSLTWLIIDQCELDTLDFLSGLENLHGLGFSMNLNLDIADFSVITPVNFPNLQYLYFSGWDRDGDGDVLDDVVSTADWDTLAGILAGFTNLRSLQMWRLFAGDANFAKLFEPGKVLATNAAHLTTLMVNELDLGDSSLGLIGGLSALEYLIVAGNGSLTDFSLLSGMNSLEYINLAGTQPQSLSIFQSLYNGGAFRNHFDYTNVDIDLSYCDLDLWEGTPDRQVVDFLESNGVRVNWNEGNNLTQGSGSLDLTIQ